MRVNYDRVKYLKIPELHIGEKRESFASFYTGKERGFIYFFTDSDPTWVEVEWYQDGRSCTGARVAPAEKSGLGRIF